MEENVIVIEGVSDTTEEIFEGIEQQVKDLTNTFRAETSKMARAFNPVIEKIHSVSTEIQKMSQTIQESLQGCCTTNDKQISYSQESPTENVVDVLEGADATIGVATALYSLGSLIVKNWGAITTAITQGLSKIPGWGIILAAVITAVAAIASVVITYWDEIVVFFTETLPAAFARFGEWISATFGDIGTFFMGIITAIVDFFSNCWNTVMAVLGGAAQWIYDTVILPVLNFFTPMIEWFSQLFQGIWQLLKDVAYNFVEFVSTSVQMVFAILLTVGTWIYLNVIQPVIKFFGQLWEDVVRFATEAWNKIVEIFIQVANWFNQNVVQPVAAFFSELWSGICQFAKAAWDGIVSVFSKVAAWFYENVVKPVNETIMRIADGFKNMANGVIGFINGMIAGIIRGINSVIEAINRIKFTVPDWVPMFGGQTMGFQLRTLTAPQIPYLAKGAVLPANKPFMAVVGDQRHGTNVEAPLTTIQEAVAVVMNEHIAAMMAGFQALLQEQRALRSTVEQIEIGDTVIGEAVDRYQEKLSIIYGCGCGL